MNWDIEMFKRDVAAHRMLVIMDDGVHRHLRFHRPSTGVMHFDLITWPGSLCYTGDMGTFVFSRLRDMFEFFRADDPEKLYQISFGYWAEKVQAIDATDGLKNWSLEKFKSEVKDYFEQYIEGAEGLPKSAQEELWEQIKDYVISRAEDSEHDGWVALRCFEHKGFEFTDWERDCKDYSYRFLWCCHALRWAINVYDQSRIAQVPR